MCVRRPAFADSFLDFGHDGDYRCMGRNGTFYHKLNIVLSYLLCLVELTRQVI